MNLSVLKIIGAILMFIDHYHFVIGGPEILNIIGRASFPIFSFALSEGYAHTRNLKKYFVRLLLSAIIFQLPVIIFNLDYPINIFFTLFFGLLAVHIFHSRKINVLLKIVLVSIIVCAAQKYGLDYGAYGILLILVFNVFRKNRMAVVTGFSILNLIIILRPGIFELASIQIYSIASLIPIFMYDGKRGRNLKYFFYIFYPGHFLLLEGIRYILEKF